jgi:hypothetical protein
MSKEEIMFGLLKKVVRDSGVDLDWRDWDVTGLYWNSPGMCPFITLAESLKADVEKACEVLSHEVGHHYMHRGKIDMEKYLPDSPKRDEHYAELIEAEADAFGRGLIRGLIVARNMFLELELS